MFCNLLVNHPANLLSYNNNYMFMAKDYRTVAITYIRGLSDTNETSNDTKIWQYTIFSIVERIVKYGKS